MISQILLGFGGVGTPLIRVHRIWILWLWWIKIHWSLKLVCEETTYGKIKRWNCACLWQMIWCNATDQPDLENLALQAIASSAQLERAKWAESPSEWSSVFGRVQILSPKGGWQQGGDVFGRVWGFWLLPHFGAQRRSRAQKRRHCLFKTPGSPPPKWRKSHHPLQIHFARNSKPTAAQANQREGMNNQHQWRSLQLPIYQRSRRSPGGDGGEEENTWFFFKHWHQFFYFRLSFSWLVYFSVMTLIV